MRRGVMGVMVDVMKVRVRVKGVMARKMRRQRGGSYRGNKNGKYERGKNIRNEEENMRTYSPPLLPSCSPFPYSPLSFPHFSFSYSPPPCTSPPSQCSFTQSPYSSSTYSHSHPHIPHLIPIPSPYSSSCSPYLLSLFICSLS